MRSLIVSIIVGCFLTSAMGCAPSDPCAAAAAKVSACTGQEVAPMDSCDSQAAEHLLAASCDQITEHPSKAISTGGWIAIAAAAVVGGWFLMSRWGNGGDNEQTQANGNASGASRATQPASQNYVPNNQVNYGANLRPINTNSTPVNYVAPSTGPLTNSYGTNAASPASSAASPASSASSAASRSTPAGSATAGPADKTNAKGCESLSATTQCVGRIDYGSLQREAGNYHFRVVSRTSSCSGGTEFRICRDIGGNCGLEYCLPNGGGYTGRCSAVDLQAGNNSALARNFTQGTLDGKALGCTAAVASTRGGGSPTPPASGPCTIGSCGFGVCTSSGCVQPYQGNAGDACINKAGAPVDAICKNNSCVRSGTTYACESPSGGPAPPGPSPAPATCACRFDQVCLADSSCAVARKQGAEQLCQDDAGNLRHNLCAPGLKCERRTARDDGICQLADHRQDCSRSPHQCPLGSFCTAVKGRFTRGADWYCRAPDYVPPGAYCMSPTGVLLSEVCTGTNTCSQSSTQTLSSPTGGADIKVAYCR